MGTPFPTSVLTCPAICLQKVFSLTDRPSIVYSCRSSGWALNVPWGTSTGHLPQTLLLQELTRFTSYCFADQSFFPLSCHLPQIIHLSPSLPLLFPLPSAGKVREHGKLKTASLPVVRELWKLMQSSTWSPSWHWCRKTLNIVQSREYDEVRWYDLSPNPQHPPARQKKSWK